MALIGVSCWSLADPSDSEIGGVVMAGLVLACSGHPRSVSAICELVPNLSRFINDLIAWLSVPVDGRVKPDHDEKPKGGRREATSNS
jgi:hypothetical protein